VVVAAERLEHGRHVPLVEKKAIGPGL
jgi:hypothetical protein